MIGVAEGILIYVGVCWVISGAWFYNHERKMKEFQKRYTEYQNRVKEIENKHRLEDEEIRPLDNESLMHIENMRKIGMDEEKINNLKACMQEEDRLRRHTEKIKNEIRKLEF